MWLIQPLIVFIGCFLVAGAVPIFALSVVSITGPYEKPRPLWVRRLSKWSSITWITMLSIEIILAVILVMSTAYWC